MKAGARAEMNHQKIDSGDGRHSLLELQLWRYEAGFLINRRTGFVLDIQGGMYSRPSWTERSFFHVAMYTKIQAADLYQLFHILGTLKLAARVVQWQRKSGKDARNQHWFYENGFIANVYNSRLVLDIDGDGSKDGAKIAVGERKAVANNDQKCKCPQHTSIPPSEEYCSRAWGPEQKVFLWTRKTLGGLLV